MVDSKISISVRNLVEFVLMSGDIITGKVGNNALVEGIIGHKAVQKSRPKNYKSEVWISHIVYRNEIELEINGRMDGLFENEDIKAIEEIKTTTIDLDIIDENFSKLHWAQAKCYAYIYGLQNSLSKIKLILTYYNRETKKSLSFEKIEDINELEEYFFWIVDEYLSWAKNLSNWAKQRDNSIAIMEFPFKSYRRGQRGFAVYVYRALQKKKKLFAQAPTGTGKSVATLFPAIKAIGEGHVDKIFYLTAKTITREVAIEALSNMRKEGLRLKTLVITAKDKVCFKEERACNPDSCEYARGYYDRLKGAIADIFTLDEFNTDTILEYATLHRICPFEFSLDLSLYCDCIICDYNYVFDPRVALKRFFSEGNTNHVFLVDEAHNLPDRAREMYSAILSKKSFMELNKKIKIKLPKLKGALREINAFFINERNKLREEDKKYYIKKESIDEIISSLWKFLRYTEEYLIKNEEAPFKEELTTLYFDVINYIKISELYDERYVTYIEDKKTDIVIKQYCVDPSYLINQAVQKSRAAVFFSATLLPMEYFIRIIGGGEEDQKLTIPSPFDAKNLCLTVYKGISTKYIDRKTSLFDVAKAIYDMFCTKKGNYIAYFPSYKYMEDVLAIFFERYSDVPLIIQESNMDEKKKEEFLNTFIPNDKGLLGFAVMGGMFSEGIDLCGDRLIGTAIVGVGLPMICLERDILKEYFDNNLKKGFDYAYVYPGMNKVLQAAGRVIRTENDKGVVLLIDDRFSQLRYKKLFPNEWRSAVFVSSNKSLIDCIKGFWLNNNNSI